MALVTVSIGSNIERDRNVRACLDALAADFRALRISRVFESEPVGFKDKRNFYNLVAAFESDWAVSELQAWCKRLEFASGRRQGAPKFGSRTLDIDLLTVGELIGEHDGVALPRDEIYRHAFVLQPLAELLPQSRHPESGETYATLWQRFDAGGQRLWAVNFTWAGREISRAE